MKPNKPTRRPPFRHPADTRAGRHERAVAVLLDDHGYVNEKVEFLRLKGLFGDEILEALDTATRGEISRVARLEKPLPERP